MQKKKRPYTKPTIKEKKMTGHFMICQNNSKQCPPGTQLRQLGTCF